MEGADSNSHTLIMKNTNRGFSLIEIIVVVSILGILILAISNFQLGVLNNNKYAFDSLTSAQDARVILGMMVRELRSTSPGNDGSFAISQAATNTITFFSDTTGSGVKDKIRYFVTANTLRRGQIKPTGSPLSYVNANETITTLAYNIKNSTSTPLFEYYNSNYTGTGPSLTIPVTTTNIRLVKINLMIDTDPNKSPIVRTYTSQVSLRNLKDNL